jgi:GT2 family glycosyltransferase
MSVTVVVPVWNGRELLDTLFGSLRGQTMSPAEIVVVDNGSSDGSAEAAADAGARVIRMGANFGFARAVNRGIAECRTEFIAIVNNDIEAAPDWLARLAAALADDGAWFAAGKILQAFQRDRLDGTFDAVCRGGCAWRIGHNRRDGPEFSSRRRIFSPPGTAALFRVALFQRVGPLDESFESYLEDVDLGLRCAAAGLGGWYVPEAVAWHRGSATLGRWHPDTVRRISRNQVYLIRKHYPARLILRCAWPILVAQTLWGLLALRHGAFLAFLGGKFAARRRVSWPQPQDAAALHAILESGEREIYHVQRKTGFDSYWRGYFLLTRLRG